MLRRRSTTERGRTEQVQLTNMRLAADGSQGDRQDVPVPDKLESLDQEYEKAEAAFLAAVRAQSERTELARSARAVAHAADVWNSEAYRVFHMSKGPKRENLDALTERTEVLSELWADIAAAFET
jgi:hypothetical protein